MPRTSSGFWHLELSSRSPLPSGAGKLSERSHGTRCQAAPFWGQSWGHVRGHQVCRGAQGRGGRAPGRPAPSPARTEVLFPCLCSVLWLGNGLPEKPCVVMAYIKHRSICAFTIKIIIANIQKLRFASSQLPKGGCSRTQTTSRAMRRKCVRSESFVVVVVVVKLMRRLLQRDSACRTNPGCLAGDAYLSERGGSSPVPPCQHQSPHLSQREPLRFFPP